MYNILCNMTHGLSRHLLPVAFALCAVMAVAMPQDTGKQNKFVLVIDAGHGGKDPGCKGETENEKTITLDVAKRLRTLVNDSCQDVSTVLTRDNDTYLTLQQRADIANRANGDLFVSIHVNSVDRKSKGRNLVHGASVYLLGADKEGATLNVAMRENAVIELEEDYTATYRGFDPQSAESYIIFELSSQQNQTQSAKFADWAQHELVTTAGRADKHVRQAGFWVLWATSMPSVLVELDFICNPTQEKFLASEQGRQQCALALFNAIKKYLAYHKAHTINVTD